MGVFRRLGITLAGHRCLFAALVFSVGFFGFHKLIYTQHDLIKSQEGNRMNNPTLLMYVALVIPLCY